MGTIEDVKLKILGFLMEVKEANAKQLEEKAECANKTFLKARQQLEQQGLIQKRYQNRKEGGLEAIYSIPERKQQTVKVMLEREALKRDFNQKISSLNSPEDIEFYKKKLAELEREREKRKLLERIRWFESLKVLPARAVRQKLEKMGFKLEDFFPPPNHGSPKLLNTGADPWLNSYFKPEDIEIKLLKFRKPTLQEVKKLMRLRREGKAKVLSPFEAPQFFFGPGWIALTAEDVRGYMIVGAYKELLQLYQKYANLQLQEIKEALHLSDKDIKALEPTLREMIFEDINPLHPLATDKIVKYIINYLVKTKKDALERVKRFYIEFGANEKDAEKWAREAIEEVKHAKILK